MSTTGPTAAKCRKRSSRVRVAGAIIARIAALSRSPPQANQAMRAIGALASAASRTNSAIQPMRSPAPECVVWVAHLRVVAPWRATSIACGATIATAIAAASHGPGPASRLRHSGVEEERHAERRDEVKDRVFRPQAEADRRAEQRPARQRSALEGVPRRPQDERPERHHADVVVELERPVGRVGRAEARQQSDEARGRSIDATDEQRDQRERAATEGERDREQNEVAPRPGRRGDAAEPRRQRRVAQIGEPPFRAVDHPFGDVGVDRPFEQRAQRCPSADLHGD